MYISIKNKTLSLSLNFDAILSFLDSYGVLAIYTFLNGCLIARYGHYFFPWIQESFLVYLETTLVIYGINFFFMAFHEQLVCLVIGARPLKTKQEKALLETLFRELCSKVKGAEYKLYMVDDLSINAYAIGSNVVAITRGATLALSKEQIKGLLAHEVGHHYHKHSTRDMVLTYMCGVFSIAMVLFKIFKRLLKHMGYNPEYPTRQENVIIRFLVGIVNLIVFMLNLIVAIFSSIRRRKREYTADNLACEIGYGAELLSALYALNEITLDGYRNMKQHITRTHPYLSDRIKNIEDGFQ